MEKWLSLKGCSGDDLLTSEGVILGQVYKYILFCKSVEK